MSEWSKMMAVFVCLLGIAGSAMAADITGRAWDDLNNNGIQDVGEPGISNVFITLYDGSTNLFDATLTDVSGGYSFTNVPNGVYFVSFLTPLTYGITMPNVGADDTDSDINDLGNTASIIINGSTVSHVDGGFYQFIPGIIFISKAGSAPDNAILYVTNGAVVQVTHTVSNSGNTALSSISVSDGFDVIGEYLCPASITIGRTITFTNTVTILSSVTNTYDVFAIPVSANTCNHLIGVNPVEDSDTTIIHVVSNQNYQLVLMQQSPTGRAPAVNEPVQFRVMITNNGGAPIMQAPAVFAYDPAYLAYESSAPPSSDNIDDGFINWLDLESIPVGGATTVLVNFTAANIMFEERTNTVVVSASFPPNTFALMVATSSYPYIVTPFVDGDSDQLPDEWEITHFGHPTNANPDAMAANGENTIRETYIADLNPTNPASFFPKIILADPPPGEMALVVDHTSTARVYQVRWSTNLLALPQDWTLLPPEKTGTGAAVSFTVTNDVSGRSYRTGVRLP